MDAYARPSQALTRRRSDSLDRIKMSARKLFIERGYHATRPQDIAREAGVGHGTFYLHFGDKRACFLSFLEDARTEFYAFMRYYIGQPASIEVAVDRILEAIYIFSDLNPQLFKAAMTDEAVIDPGNPASHTLLQSWGREWAQIVRAVGRQPAPIYDPNIVGQAILGAIQQGRIEGDRAGIPREVAINNLRLFLLNALKL